MGECNKATDKRESSLFSQQKFRFRSILTVRNKIGIMKTMLLLSLIISGCSTPCSEGYATDSNGNCVPFSIDTSEDVLIHPYGYGSPEQHSVEAKLGTSQCTECHGEDLRGEGDANSCDQCHSDGWRSDCTFCHGGDDNNTGAPPRDINGSGSDSSFGAHSAHVISNDHMEYECSECHIQPDNVVYEGHMFDSTPGVSEIAFNPDLNSSATWSEGSCSNLYCHSNGQGDLGTVDASDTVECGDCHAGNNDSSSEWVSLSGKHKKHLQEGLNCSDCHESTINEVGHFTGPDLHVNGEVNVSISSLVYTEAESDGQGRSRCDGACHDKNHNDFIWQ